MAPNGCVDGNEERPRIQRLSELAQRKRATDSSATLSPLWGYPPPHTGGSDSRCHWRCLSDPNGRPSNAYSHSQDKSLSCVVVYVQDYCLGELGNAYSVIFPPGVLTHEINSQRQFVHTESRDNPRPQRRTCLATCYLTCCACGGSVGVSSSSQLGG